MPKVAIIVELEPENSDPNDATGLTNEAYERLTDPMDRPLGWLGEIDDVSKVVGSE